MEQQNIKLGDRVQDQVSGYIGIAVARTQFLNGCVQYSVLGKIKSTEKYNFEGDPSFDEMNLKIIKRNVVNSKEYEKEKKVSDNGGKTTCNKRMRGY